MQFISIKPVLSDHLSYMTTFHSSFGKSHKTGLTAHINVYCCYNEKTTMRTVYFMHFSGCIAGLYSDFFYTLLKYQLVQRVLSNKFPRKRENTILYSRSLQGLVKTLVRSSCIFIENYYLINFQEIGEYKFPLAFNLQTEIKILDCLI